MKEKLKKLRERLRWWNKEVYGWIDLQFQENVKELNELDKDLSEVKDDKREDVISRRKKVNNSIWNYLMRMES